MQVKVNMKNLDQALSVLRGLRAAQDPVSPIVQDVRAVVGDCCKHSKKEFVGQIAVPDDGTGRRFKEMRVCACCQQLHIDGDCRVVTGNLREYLENLVTKHGQIELFVQNEAALGSARPVMPNAR